MQFKNMQSRPNPQDTCHRCGTQAGFMIKIHYPSFEGVMPGLKYPMCDECWGEWGELLMRHDEEKLVFLGLIKERKVKQ